jgi:uncharacterized repeat protein (TIGR02543 family)
MKNTRCFKWITWLLAMIAILSMSALALGQGQETFEGNGIELQELDSTFVTSKTIFRGNTKIKEKDFYKEDPNNSFTLHLEVSEPANANSDPVMLPPDTDAVPMIYPLENMTAENGGNEVVSWTYSEDEDGGMLIFKWKGTKQTSFTADITVSPAYPDTLKIGGQYMLGTVGTKAILTSDAYSDAGRKKLVSYQYEEENGYITPMTDTDYTWVLSHVTGDYYTIKSANNGSYLAIGKENGKGILTLQNVEEKKAQKFRVKQVNGGYAFIYNISNVDFAINNSGNNPTMGFASYNYSNGEGNETFKLFSESEIVHAAKEDKTGTWAVMNANKKMVLTAKTSSANKLAAVATDLYNDVYYPRNDISAWTFEHVNRDWYTVKTSTGYLNITSSGITVSDKPQSLLVQKGNEYTDIILTTGKKDTDFALTLYNNEFASVKVVNNDNTKITLKSDQQVKINETEINGTWAITTDCSGAAVVAEQNNNKLVSVPYALSDDGSVASLEKQIALWTFTKVDGNWYTVKSDAGYLNIINGTVSLSSEETRVYIQEIEGKYRITAGNQWALNNTSRNARNGYGGYDKGYAADPAEWHSLRSVKTDVDSQLLFDVNNGTVTERPESILSVTGEKVILPDMEANLNGASFVGWAETNNFYKANGDEKTCYHKLFKAGDEFTMKTGITTLYAVYDTTSHDIRFGVRLDGNIQDEPNSYDVKWYGGHFWAYGIRKANSWVIDISSQKSVNGYYMINDVSDALNWIPSADEIAAALKTDGKVDFDPETQYIHWYVMKYTTKEWHIDGVIRSKVQVSVTYDTNVDNANEKMKIPMPAAYQVPVGTSIIIGTNKGATTVVTPKREGYVFKGWNTEKDGSGTDYAEESYLKLTDNLHLYAQWVEIVEDNLIIKITSDWPEGKPAYAGTLITLTANLTGFENKIYTLQWEYTTDGENWNAQPNENNVTMTYEMNETTAQYCWRVVAYEIRNKQ